MTSSKYQVEINPNEYMPYDPAFGVDDPGDVLDQSKFCPNSFAPLGNTPVWVTSIDGNPNDDVNGWKYEAGGTGWTHPKDDYYCFGAPDAIKKTCFFNEEDSGAGGMKFAMVTCNCDGWIVQDIAIADSSGDHKAAGPELIPVIHCPEDKNNICSYPNIKVPLSTPSPLPLMRSY
jgi:hypothetical protein